MPLKFVHRSAIFLLSRSKQDGLVFDSGSIEAEEITQDADYAGPRICFQGRLDSARVHMQIDIGFGDVVYPKPEESKLPTLLDSPAAQLLCYSRESAIAEKFEAMVKLRELNSRMKDFYDIWLLSRQFYFEGEYLAEAIRLTFERRGTTIPNLVPTFTEEFAVSKQIQWKAFHRRFQQGHVPAEFSEVVLAVQDFIEPLCQSLVSSVAIPGHWVAAGSWRPGRKKSLV